MTLKYVVGDLCDALERGEVDAIGHQANCFNTMNSGVAKAIRTRFPQAYEADCQTIKGDIGKLGDLTLATGGSGLIYNLYGQYSYGYDSKGYTNYDALQSALFEMREDLLTGRGFKVVGFPKIGAGLGGGDWDTIEEIINDIFEGYFEVVIYVLREEDVPKRSEV